MASFTGSASPCRKEAAISSQATRREAPRKAQGIRARAGRVWNRTMAFFRPKLSATLPPASEPGTQARADRKT